MASLTRVPAAQLSLASSRGLLLATEKLEDAFPSDSYDSTDAIDLVAWGCRFSVRRAEEAASLSWEDGACADGTELAGRGVPAAVGLRGALAFLARVVRAIPPRRWAFLGGWLVLGKIFKYLGFGAPFVIGSLICLIFMNLGTRGQGESSAYTVFNDGRALPGQLQQEDFEREILHQ
ncbi:MAG: hypothetical protein SGPRY_013846 [Prymnesium sp.]